MHRHCSSRLILAATAITTTAIAITTTTWYGYGLCITSLRKTLASSSKSECGGCRQQEHMGNNPPVLTFVGSKFYCPHAFADDNYHIQIREKTLEFSVVLPAPSEKD